MIFITVGSQKFQFDRLLKEVDRLIEKGVIKEEVVAQTGFCKYEPKNYKAIDFLTREEFNNYICKSSIIITHAGTGSIINAVINEKKVIAVPRLAKFGEHVDDHQIQIIDSFSELDLIEAIYDVNQIEKALDDVRKKTYNKYKSNTEVLIDDIDQFLSSVL